MEAVLAFPPQREPALLRSFLLAGVMHAVLIGVMFVGVRMQSYAPETVEVELWEAPPPQPEPQRNAVARGDRLAVRSPRRLERSPDRRHPDQALLS